MLEIVIAAVIALVAGIVAGKLIFAKNTRPKDRGGRKPGQKRLWRRCPNVRGKPKAGKKRLEAKEKFVQLKAEHDKDVLEKNRKVNEAEARIKQKEQGINQKLENLDKQAKDNDAIKENLNRQIELVNIKRTELEETPGRTYPSPGKDSRVFPQTKQGQPS